MSNPLEIEVIDQHWLWRDPDCRDKCSHGRLRVLVGGCEISDPEVEYGISTSALGLLRTLECDSDPAPSHERLIKHGCGAILMLSCPIGIDWSVRHESGNVRIGDVVTYPSTDESKGTAHPEAVATMSLTEYRRVVLELASGVLNFFHSQPPREFSDPFDRQDYDEFWGEFRAIYERQRDR